MYKPPTSRRFRGLDQARGAAILAMLAAHFAPGVFSQFPRLEPLRVPVLAFARLATPTFVAVFGVTIGFVYLPRYLRGELGRQPGHRAAVMLLCAAAVALPGWGRLTVEGVDDPWAWMFGLYSVLLFYALALGVLPAWLRWLVGPPGRGGPGRPPGLRGPGPAGGRPEGIGPMPVGSRELPAAPAMKCVLAGAGLWAIGTAGHRLVPQMPPSGPEFVRMTLASGSYAYCQLMGTALFTVPVGVRLRAAWEARADRQFLGTLFGASLVLAALGGLWGFAAGEYDPGRLLSGELRTPPRAWYFLHIGGFGLALVPALELVTRAVRPLRPAGYLLALFGQGGLMIYTGHAFVLPGLAVADRVVPLHGAARVATALVPFAAFCALVMYGRHRRANPQSPRPYGRGPFATSSPSSTPSASVHCPPSR